MMRAWGLPRQAELDGVRYEIRTDYRDILEILRWLGGRADPELDAGGRWYVAMRLFYPEFAAMPQEVWPRATEFLTGFLAAGHRAAARPGPPLMDWQQDAPLIAAGISRAAGQDVRTLPYLHWWSFLALFDAIGEGSFAMWWPSGTSCAAASGWKTGSWTITAPTARLWSCAHRLRPRKTQKSSGCWRCCSERRRATRKR